MVYAVYFTVLVSFLVGITIAGLVHIRKQSDQPEEEPAVRSKRHLLPMLGVPDQSGFFPGVSGSSAGSSANAITNNLDGFGGFSGSNAASNALSQNIGGFGISSSNANANAFSQGFNSNGFGSSAANAQAQSFQSNSPFGSFGASAANAASQGFSVGPGGLSGSAGQSGSQSYNLPGNRKISLSYSNGFSLANGAPSVSNGFSISQS